MTSIGIKLKKLREKHRLTQKMLSDKIDVSQGRLSEIEQGKNFPSYETLISIKNFFQVSLDWLVSDDLEFSLESNTYKNDNKASNALYTCPTAGKKETILTYLQELEHVLEKFPVTQESINQLADIIRERAGIQYKTKKQLELSDEEMQLLELYNQLEPKEKGKAERYIEELIERRRGKN